MHLIDTQVIILDSLHIKTNINHIILFIIEGRVYMCTVTTHNTFMYGLPTKTKLQNGKPPYPYSKILILITKSLSLYQNPYPYS